VTTQANQTNQKKTNEPLTAEQKLMVEENLRLVYFLSRKYRPPLGMDLDDWQSEVMVELVRAVKYHDPARGKLSTVLDHFVYRRRGHLNDYFKRGKRGRVIKYSLDAEVSLLDMQGEDHHWNGLDAAMVTKQALGFCTPQEADILQRLAQDYTIREIADHYGVSHQRICQHLTIARRKCASAMPGELIQTTKCIRCGGGAQQYNLNKNLYCCQCSYQLLHERKLSGERGRLKRLKLAKKNG
jgi:RNA polymerase sigma factor (sigma-70 family)